MRARVRFQFISALIMAGGVPAFGQSSVEGPEVYAYPGKDNYCQAGLQPVSISGVISCGTPSRSNTYQQMLAHPIGRGSEKRVRLTCPDRANSCTDV